MSKITVKGATLLAPLPVVMVSVGDGTDDNIVTVAWTGIVCSDPPRMYISIRHERHSYELLKKHREFVVNLVNQNLLASCDYCGIRSGRDINKFSEMKLTKSYGDFVKSPMITESPINLECKVFDIIDLGSHDMFLADILAVHASEDIVVDGKIDYKKAQLCCYQHGDYYATGKQLGRFGFAAQKKFIAKYGKGIDVDLKNAKLTKRKITKK